MIRRTLIFLLFLAATSGSALATTIQYELSFLGSDIYRYDYTVINDGSLGVGVPIEGIDIYFDAALYDELSLVPDGPTGWDPMIIYSTPDLPALYDIIALSPEYGIQDGSYLSGFSVEFKWLGGPEIPGTQPFEIYSLDNLSVLDNGQTTNPVPEPGTMALLALGLFTMKFIRKKLQ